MNISKDFCKKNIVGFLGLINVESSHSSHTTLFEMNDLHL